VASMSEFGQSEIETYISAMTPPYAQYFGGDAFEYTNDKNGIILNGTPANVLSLIWAAWIYARMRSDVASDDKKQMWQRAAEQLYDSMEDFYDSPENKCFGESNKLLSMADDAMKTMGTYMAEQIKKSKYAQSQQPVPAKQQVSTGEDTSKLQARIKELEEELSEQKAENKELKAENAELRKQLEECQNQNIEQPEVKNEDWIVELLSHLCYEDEQVAKAILNEIRGKEDPVIADIIFERKKQNKISPKTQNRELWKIFHAAKLYRGIEGNFNTALRRRQRR
ncbi:MAG: hypothetical protein IKO71_06370, partial [Bacteroidaceae bacterium]|nr:hypothetical protein [Bacteroidaceae bacterium]